MRSLFPLPQVPFGVHVSITPRREGFLWGHEGWWGRDGVDQYPRIMSDRIACDMMRDNVF